MHVVRVLASSAISIKYSSQLGLLSILHLSIKYFVKVEPVRRGYVPCLCAVLRLYGQPYIVNAAPSEADLHKRSGDYPDHIIQETVSAREPVREPLMEMPDLGTMRTAEGGSVAFGGMKYTAYARKEEPVSKMKPQLTDRC